MEHKLREAEARADALAENVMEIREALDRQRRSADLREEMLKQVRRVLRWGMPAVESVLMSIGPMAGERRVQVLATTKPPVWCCFVTQALAQSVARTNDAQCLSFGKSLPTPGKQRAGMFSACKGLAVL